MISFTPMTEDEFAHYVDRLAAAYAKDQVASGAWDRDTALKQATEKIHQSLPQGLATPNQLLYLLHTPGVDEAVGQLWIRIDGEPADAAFIMDIEIYPPFQRHGYAQQTLQTLEKQVKALGIDKIGLHVHVQNRGARALYEKMGFSVTGYSMVKHLEFEQ